MKLALIIFLSVFLAGGALIMVTRNVDANKAAKAKAIADWNTATEKIPDLLFDYQWRIEKEGDASAKQRLIDEISWAKYFLSHQPAPSGELKDEWKLESYSQDAEKFIASRPDLQKLKPTLELK